MPQPSICVFCGARSGEKPIYRQAAEELGQALVQNNWRLVYGAGDIGLMGAVARATQAEGGATLNGLLAAIDCIDELNLSISPQLNGGDGPRLTSAAPALALRMELAHVLEDDSYLFTRYLRAR